MAAPETPVERTASEPGTLAARSASSTRVRDLAAAALVAALMAAFAWISIPVGAVPITLQVFVVVLAALLLPAAWAFYAMLAYLVLGAIGVPVFAGGHAGLGVLLGPTGGYLIGFALAAPLGAFLRQTLERRGARQIVVDTSAAVLVVLVIYLTGWAQLTVVAHLTPLQAFVAGVVPFVGPDAVKAAVAIAVAAAVRKAGVRL
jgi:biotin transport system substrate-specific component